MGQGFESLQARQPMVGIVQWLERQIVALEADGSTPFIHPIRLREKSERLQFDLTFSLILSSYWDVAKR